MNNNTKQTETELPKLEQQDLQAIKMIAKTYVRFRELESKKFTFVYDSNPVITTSKLQEVTPLFTFVIERMYQLNKEKNKEPIKKMEQIIAVTESLILNKEFLTNISRRGGDLFSYRKISSIIFDNKMTVVKILSLCETIRPQNIKPLSKSEIGGSIDKYEDIEQETDNLTEEI